MRVPLRETGSIVLHARKDEVLDVLRRSAQGALVAPDRIESDGSTYIVREARAGTQVIHARQASAAIALATREREELRRAVESDLFRLQRHFDVK